MPGKENIIFFVIKVRILPASVVYGEDCFLEKYLCKKHNCNDPGSDSLSDASGDQLHRNRTNISD